MLTPNYAARIDLATGTETRMDAEDVEFWTQQWIAFPEDFVVRRVPATGEFVIFERNGARYVGAWVTSGWPQRPATW